MKNYLNPRGFRILAALDAVAERHNAKPAEVALAWIIQRKGVTAPIASATRLDQLESLIKATTLDAERGRRRRARRGERALSGAPVRRMAARRF